MENPNSLPHENLSPNIKPSTQESPSQPTPSFTRPPDAQIFIHPEHEAGTLAVAQQISPKTSKKKTDKMFLLLSIVIALLIVAGSGIFFILIPRSQNVTFATSVKETVSSSSERTEKVNSSLEILYKAITAQAEDVTLSQNQNIRFISTKEDSFGGVFDSASRLVQQTKDNLSKKEDVKSFAVPAGDPNQEARKHRELAQDISEKAKSAEELNAKLLALINKPIPNGSKDLKDETTKLHKSTKDYIDQSTNTSDYYVAISEASIELVTMASSIYSEKDIENAISKLTSLRTKFAEYEKSKLPQGIDNYNKDIVETFDLLLILYKDVNEGKLKTEQQIVNAYTNFMNDLQSVSVRAVNDEVSFWQNNQALNSFDKLSDKQTQVQKDAETVKDNNNFFLLEWAGVT